MVGVNEKERSLMMDDLEQALYKIQYIAPSFLCDMTGWYNRALD